MRNRDRIAALEEERDAAVYRANAAQAGVAQLGERLAALEEKVAAAPQNASGDQPIGTAHLAELFGGTPSYAGPVVTPETAMRASAVFACTRILAEAIAGLSLPIYERAETGRKRAPVDAANGYWWLLNEQPSPAWSAAAFWERMVADMLNRKDGLALIGRRGTVATEFIPLDRDATVIEKKGGRLRYYTLVEGVGWKGFDQDDVLHFPGFGFNGTHGMSVLQYAALQAVGIALGAEEWAARFFSNGALPKFAIEIPGALKDAQAEDLKADWRDTYAGTGNAHLPLILRHGAKAVPISLNAEDSQLLQTRVFQVVDIARAYGVPPFMIGETEKVSSWGTGIEAMGLGFVRYTLRGPIQRIEQELNRKLWPRSTKYFVEFNTDSLMRGDSKAEADYFRASLGGAQGSGWMTVNEVRRIKNLPPVDGGDELYLAKAKETPDANPEPREPRPAPGGPPSPDPRPSRG